MYNQLDIFSLGIENPNISNDDKDIIKSSELSIIKIRSFFRFESADRYNAFYKLDKIYKLTQDLQAKITLLNCRTTLTQSQLENLTLQSERIL